MLVIERELDNHNKRTRTYNNKSLKKKTQIEGTKKMKMKQKKHKKKRKTGRLKKRNKKKNKES